MIVSKDALWKGIIESLIDEFIHFFFLEYAEVIDFERGFEFLDTLQTRKLWLILNKI